MIKINFCNKKLKNNLIFFLKNNWPRKSIVFSNQRLFDWLFLNKRLKNYNFLIAKNKNEILSCIAIIKSNFLNNKKKNKNRGFIWMTFWLSKRSQSSYGISLIYYILKKYKNYIIGTTGCNPTVFKIYKILGFKTGYLSQFYFVNPTVKKFLINKLLKRSRKIKKKQNNYILEVEKEMKFYNEIENLHHLENKFLKNKKYFKDKYYKNPYFNYLFYVLKRKNKIYGFFVGRDCKFKNKKNLRFIEFFGNLNYLNFFQNNLQNLVIKSKYECIDFYCNGLNEKILLKAGFKKNQFKNNVIIPNYFEPFLKKNIKIAFAIWPNKNMPPFFKGDGDQDRPNKV